MLPPLAPCPPREAVRVCAYVLIVNYLARCSQLNVDCRKFVEGWQSVAIPRDVRLTKVLQVIMKRFACRHTARRFNAQHIGIICFADLHETVGGGKGIKFIKNENLFIGFKAQSNGNSHLEIIAR